MEQQEAKEQYEIEGKDDKSNHYTILISLIEQKNLIRFIVELDMDSDAKFHIELDFNQLKQIHHLFNNEQTIKNIKDAYNELIALLKDNKNHGEENTIEIDQNLILLIPYKRAFKDFIKFELKKEGLNLKNKVEILFKTVEALNNQIKEMNKKIIELESNNNNNIYKEYDSEGNLIFEGNFLIKSKGKGKEYNSKGEIIFEGEYKDGKRYNGKGKEYNSNGKIIFEGEYKDGKRYNGKGVISNYEKHRSFFFNGEYKDGKFFNGKIKSKKHNPRYFGFSYDYDYDYDLEIENGSDYKGKKIRDGKLIFEGYFKKINDYEYECKSGKFYNKNGKLYFEGESEFKGNGIFYDLNGMKSGEIINGSGKCLYYNYSGELKFKGKFKDGKYEEGEEYYDDGKLKFKGKFKDGKYYEGKEFCYEGGNLIKEIEYKEGKGKEFYYKDILSKVIEYKEGEELKRKEYDINDDLIFQGIIENGNKIGTKYIKTNSQMFLKNEQGTTRQQNANEIVLNSPNPEEEVIFIGTIKNELFWTGSFYSLNNNNFEEKKEIGRLTDGNGKLKKNWEFEEFEGEVRNGILWKGPYKKFNVEGKVIFEGEYKEGNKFKGKEYNNDGKKIYEGEYKEGKRKKGKEYDNGKVIFEGEYDKGIKFKGKEYDKYSKELKFEGEYKDGKKWNGYLIIDDWSNKFKGEIREGNYWEGQAKFGDKFIGEMKEGKYWNGYGIGENGEYDKIFKNGKVFHYN